MSIGALLACGPFLRSDASRAGVGRRRLDRLEAAGRVVRVCREVYLPAHLLDDVAGRAAAVGLVLPRGAAVCRETAAWLHGVDLRPPGRHTEPPRLQCLVPAGRAPVRRPGLECYSSSLVADDLCTVKGVVVTTPERTVVDVGRWSPTYVGLAALDAFAHAGLVDPECLARRLPALKGQRHVARLRRLVGLCEPASESMGESWMRLRVLDAGLPRPQVQIRIEDRGRQVYRLDAGYAELRAGFEYDGEEYHALTPEQAAADEARRDDLLRRFGWTVIGVTRAQVLGARPAVEVLVADLIGWTRQLRRRMW